jgi:hypothetical protein
LRFTSQTFWLAKDAEFPEQYQDAFELDAQRGVAAIADGVSSAIFSGPWARILTCATIDEPPRFEQPGEFQEWLDRQRAAWAATIDTSKLTWYQRPKMVDGAMTTLLWVELWPEETGDDGLAKNYQLYGFAIGDSCLFHVREGRTLVAFPLTASTEFGLDPAVVRSIDRKLDHLLEFRTYYAPCLPGDLLVLATDAIALWAIERQETGDAVDWEAYWGMTDDAWRDEIFSLRSQTRMRFDDSTLVLLRVVEETPAPRPPAVEGAPAEEGALETPSDEPAAAEAPSFDSHEIPDDETVDNLVLPDNALMSADGEPAPLVDVAPSKVDAAATTLDVVGAPNEAEATITEEFVASDEQARGLPPGT